MRTLLEIKAEILKHEQVIEKLEQEVKDFQSKCPHPDAFISVTHNDIYDEAGAPVYEKTYSTASCSLCGKKVTKGYWGKERSGYYVSINYKTARELLDE